MIGVEGASIARPQFLPDVPGCPPVGCGMRGSLPAIALASCFAVTANLLTLSGLADYGTDTDWWGWWYQPH
jgi:hypothetical protein